MSLKIAAGRIVFASHWANLYEEAGHSLSQTEIFDVCLFPADEVLEDLIAPYWDRITDAWGASPERMMDQMAIHSADHDRFVSDLFLWIMGAGISLEDRFDWALEDWEKKTGAALTIPFRSDFPEILNLAAETVND